MAHRPRTLIDRISDIDVEDLQYVERDLCYYELVSLGFLLYGRERTQSEFILQKLIVLSQNPPKGKGTLVGPNGAILAGSDILQKYATINTETWRVNMVEALAIIGAKKVLRKLGFRWQELYDHYLPHIVELSVHIHPLLKALYKICERLSIAQAGRLVMKINELHLGQDAQHFRFYDYGYLEVFLLHWMTRRVIAVGNQMLVGADVQALLSYFKLNDLDAMKSVLVHTINHNSEREVPAYVPVVPSDRSNMIKGDKDSGAVMDSEDMVSQEQTIVQEEDEDYAERYIIRAKRAGFVLIINQREFYEETDPDLKHLLPEKKFGKSRNGTDEDRDKLKDLFSSFGYTAFVFNNLTHVDMLHEIRQTVEKCEIRDSLIVCILSHGREGVVYGCNSIPVSINSIKAIMTADKLKGKPKMLIIQACQKYIAPVDTSVSNSERNFQPNDYADMLVAMSSIAGTEAFRHVETGSWYIQSLCEMTGKYGDKKHMFDILTKVTEDVAKKHTGANEFMMPTTNSTLRKYFYLPKRI